MANNDINNSHEGSIIDFEMMQCCDMQIDRLISLLNEYKDNESEKNKLIKTNLPSAPIDDSFFDSLRIVIEIKLDTVEVTGAVSFWDQVNGYSGKTRLIRVFKSISDCREWLSKSDLASKECAELLSCL